jgi:hypothetical protein
MSKAAKKVKPFVFHTAIEPYGWNVSVFTDQDQHKNFLAKKGHCIQKDVEYFEGMAAHYPHGTAIYLRQVTAPVLLHELVHAVTKCFHDRGVPLSEDATEVLAYTLERLFDSCTYALNRGYKG